MKLSHTVSRLKKSKILVAGDFLLDTYTIGKAKRISPEAPVCIVNVGEEKFLPGGAGNVALNLISLGCDVFVCGRVGKDPQGDLLKGALEKENIKTSNLFQDASFKTPVKNRIISDNQQMIRVDYETITPLPEKLEKEIIESLDLTGFDAVAVSDYGKGFFTNSLLSTLLTACREKGIPAIVDPKGADFSKYKQAFLIKPNLKEAFAASQLAPEAPLEAVAEKLFKESDAKYIMITRSEAGISLFTPERFDSPVKVKEVKDVTGAGDTVLALMTHCIASKISLFDSVELANLAASLAIEHVGCFRITLSDLAKRLLEENKSSKIFDHSHFEALSLALKDDSFSHLEITHEKELNSELFQKIQKFKAEKPLIVSFPENPENPHFLDMMLSLKEVDYIYVGKLDLQKSPLS